MTDPARTFAAAEQALAGGRPGEAVALLDRLAPPIAHDPAVLHLRALALKQAGDHAAARAAFERAHKAAPGDPQIANNYANLLKQMGEAEAALTLYDRALAAQPLYRDARFNKAVTLQSLGRHAEALTLLEALCAANAGDARAQSARGSALLALSRPAEAATAFDAALARMPALATALKGRAQAALEQGEAEAPARFVRARQADPASPELVIGLAEALEAEGDPQGMALLTRAVAERPTWLAGLERLARMRAEAGEADFAGHYAPAVAQAPNDRTLRLSWAAALAAGDRYREALAALQPLPDDPELILVRAFYSGEAGDAAAGLRMLKPVSETAAVALMRSRLALASGDLDRALTAIDRAVTLAPDSVSAWAHAELAWRMTGDPRSEWLSGQPGLYGPHEIGLNDNELVELAALLRSLHRTRAHPIGQSLRGGTQTRGRLFLRTEPALARLHAALTDAVEAHRAGLPPEDPAHPLLRHRNDRLAIAGSWSVRLTSSGFHVSHIHSQGLLSSACYIALPPAVGDEDAARQGWLELGRPPRELRMPLEPVATIAPRPGRLALFPSYLYHGTRPFADGERLTVAFDVVPG